MTPNPFAIIGKRIFIKQEIFLLFSFLLKMYFWLIVMTVTNNNCISVETTVISVSVLWPASDQSSFGDSWEVTTHTHPPIMTREQKL